MPRRAWRVVGLDERQVEVPDDDHDRDVHERVVEEDRSREAEPRVAFAVPEQQTGDEEEDGERSGEDRVDFLARVEPPLWRVRVPGQEAPVVPVEEVDLADRLRERAPVAERRDQENRAPAQEMPVQKWTSLSSGRRATVDESDGK